MRLKNKVAIVTGASSGIGAKTAEVFAKEGATVILVARRIDRLEENVKAIVAAGGKAVAMQADVTIEAESIKVIEETVAKFGRIDVLVNNAGIGDKHMPIDKCSTDWWNEVISVNQTSVFYMSKAALKYMSDANYGSIVNVSSIGGVFGSAGISYSASKSAILGMTKNIAMRFAPQGIRCNAVCPGPTPTELNLPEKMAQFDDFKDQCAKHMNMELPETDVLDQANAILFFASDEAKAVNGQVLIVDNGITL